MKAFLKVKYLDLISGKLQVAASVPDMLALLQDLIVFSRMDFFQIATPSLVPGVPPTLGSSVIIC